MARRRGERTEVYVEMTFPGSSEKLKYGFLCTESFHTKYKSELGQVSYNGAVGVVFGCNSPKPFRASKEETDGDLVSSFCADAKIKSLRSAGWIISRTRKIRGIKTSGRSVTVYVDMPGGYKYAYNLNKAETTNASVLGLTLANGSEKDLVWGSEPKPPRASKRTAQGQVSTFISPKQSVITAASNAGWTISAVSYALTDDSPN
ncbi:MAG: hypothetical protein F6K36_28525 [Symploca sp. SIO3C6]|nr:hypothetical protein [Symploca sp. SIO3C6]